MSFISHRCIHMVERKQIQFSGQPKIPHALASKLRSSSLEFAVIGTYKHLLKQSFRL